MKTLVVISALFTQFLFAAKVEVKSGGVLIPSQATKRYLETQQMTEVLYTNKLIGAEAEVSLRAGQVVSVVNEKNEVERSDWYRPNDFPMKKMAVGVWSINLEHLRHKLGGQEKIHGLSFEFVVTYPGQTGEVDHCKNDPEKVYRTWFQDIHKLPWENSATPIKLEQRDWDCVWRDSSP